MDEWVLITGASSGIGRELARVFAAHGFSLVLLARDEARLKELAAECERSPGVKARVLARDLAPPNAADEVFEALRDTPVGILVNNAGFGFYGYFAESDLRVQTDLMQVNMIALVQLTHRFVQPMIARRRGRVLNVASVAAFLPGPTVNLYYASKAFVFSFSYALAEELEGTGVTVTTLCPGSTRTEFFTRANIHMNRPWPLMEARAVAEVGYHATMKGRRVAIPGWSNKLICALVKRFPPRLPARVVRKVHAPGPRQA